MSIKKYKTKAGATRYLARAYAGGRGSKQIAKVFSRRIDAENYLADFRIRVTKQVKIANGSLLTFEETSVRKEAEYYLEHKREFISPSSYKTALAILRKLLPEVGHLKPNELHKGRVVQLQNTLIRAGASVSSVNRKIGTLHAILNFSVENERLLYNPMAKYKKLKNFKKEVGFWEKDEALEFLRFANLKYPPRTAKRWIYLAYLTAINTGLRAAELWALRPCDLIQEATLIQVRRQLDRVNRSFRRTKGQGRKVPCNLRLRSEFREWISLRNVASNDVIFRNDNGQVVYHENFRRRSFLKDIKEAGMRPIRFHDLRHTAGTLMVGQGIDLVTVKEILGHEDIKTTMIYTHALGENLREVA